MLLLASSARAAAIVIALSFGNVSAFAQAIQTQIDSYRDTKGKIATYDSSGRSTGVVDVTTLPPIGSRALDETGQGLFYRVETANGPVWLSPTSVKVKDRARAKTECESVSKLQKQSAAARPQVGMVGRGLNECKD